jgi:hypothetical protein
MCVCEHYQKEHKIKINHMEGRIIDKIKELEAGILELNKKQKSIVEYTSKAETATREKDKIKDEIETKIGKAKEFWQKQNEVVILKHEAIVKSYESIVKAANDCEHNIKLSMDDPKKMTQNAKKHIKEKKYMTALSEVEKALTEDAKIDETIIKAQMQKHEKLIEEFRELLENLDIGVLDIPKAKKLQADKNELETANADFKGKHKSFIIP